MFRKMLVCTDLSPASDALIRCVEELKSIGMEEVILTHVTFLSVEAICTEETSPILQHQKSYLEERGIRVTVEMPYGLPAHAIDEIAEKHDVSAILIGSHGKGILQSALLGSVSTQLLQQMRRPVLLVRIALLEDGSCETVCGRMFARVLFPNDFSDTAERALNCLVKINWNSACPLTVIHVLERNVADEPDPGVGVEEARCLLDENMRRLKAQGVSDVASEIVLGDPAEAILRYAREGGYSIIVMGGQGKGIFKELFLGSVANEVARRAETPVLFIPAHR